MAQQHGEGCFCYDCVTRWAAEHDPNTGRRRSSGRSYGPPIAKNPANQEYINQCWKEERKARERQQRRGGRRGVGKTVEGAVTIVTALSGLTAEPPVDQVYSAGDAYDQTRYSLSDGDNRDKYLDEQTRAANDRKGGSSRRR